MFRWSSAPVTLARAPLLQTLCRLLPAIGPLFWILFKLLSTKANDSALLVYDASKPDTFL